MILCEYQIRFPTMQVKEIEVEEKLQSYLTNTNSRILKKEIGIVKHTWRCTLYLLEKDFDKAKKLFLEYMNKELELHKVEIEQKQKALENYVKNINQFNAMQESDVIEWR